MGVQTLSRAIEVKAGEEGDNVSRSWLWRTVRFIEGEVRAGYGRDDRRRKKTRTTWVRERRKGSTEKDPQKKKIQFKCWKNLEDEQFARKKFFQIEIIKTCQNSHG